MPNKMRFWAYPVPAVLVAFTLLAGQAPLPEPVTDLETELGKAVYDQLKEKGEIVEASPLYDSLRPIAKTISQAAQIAVNFAKLPELLGKPPPSPELPQFAASSMDGCVDDQDYNDGAQNDHPIGNLNARYRRLLAKPFRDFLPYSNSSSPRTRRDGHV